MTLTFTTLWADSADDKLMTVFSENSIWQFMQIVSYGDNLYELSNRIFWKKKKSDKNILKCRLMKFLPSVLSMKYTLM